MSSSDRSSFLATDSSDEGSLWGPDKDSSCSSDEEECDKKSSHSLSDVEMPCSSDIESSSPSKKQQKQEFKCILCTKVFLHKGSFDRHLLMHSKIKRFICHVCEKPFSLKGDLKRHLSTHGTTVTYDCNLCTKQFSLRNNLTRHLKDIHKITFPKLSKKELEEGNLKVHMTIHSRSAHGSFDCKICNITFSQKSNLIRHFKEMHKIVNSKPSIQNCESPTYKCDICNEGFQHQENYEKHLSFHTAKETSFKCDVCGKVFSRKGNLKTHMTTHTRESLPCKKCTESFPSKKELMRHVMAKHVEKRNANSEDLEEKMKFKCNYCVDSYTLEEDLNIHLFFHKDPDSLECMVCGKTCKLRGVLKIHYRSHMKAIDYSCNVCNKQFYQKSSLDRHIKFHSEKKIYKCILCPSQFWVSSELQVHLREKHKGENPFKCTLCSKGYESVNRLNHHKRVFHKIRRKYTSKQK